MTVQKIFGSLSIFVVEVWTWPMACITLVIAAPPHSLVYAKAKNKERNRINKHVKLSYKMHMDSIQMIQLLNKIHNCWGLSNLLNTCYWMSMNTAAVNVQIVAHRFVNWILHNSFTFHVLVYQSTHAHQKNWWWWVLKSCWCWWCWQLAKLDP